MLVCTISLSSYIIAVNARPVRPWKGWADTHAHFSHVLHISTVQWRANGSQGVALQMSRFFKFLCALVFFAFFGFAKEVREWYRNALISLFRRKPSFKPDTSSSSRFTSILPMSTHQKSVSRHDFMRSYSSNHSVSKVGTDDSLSTLGHKPEYSSEIGSLPPTPFSPLSIPEIPLSSIPSRPAPSHVDARDSRISWTPDRRKSVWAL